MLLFAILMSAMFAVVASSVVNAPVLGVALPIGVLLIDANVDRPATTLPPTYSAPLILAPPKTCSAPVLAPVAGVVLARINSPVFIVP